MESNVAQPELHRKNELHLARKLWHFGGVTWIAIIFHLVSRPTAIQLMTLLTVLGILVDFLRQQSPKINNHVIRIFGPVMREHERKGLAGTSFLFLGVLLIILYFPPQIVLLTLLFLAIADPLASYFGILYGRDKLFGSKSLQGSLAAFFACVIVAGIFYSAFDLMRERMFLASLCTGIVGALAELIPVGRLDDNFTFPILCASGLWVVFYFFGGF